MNTDIRIAVSFKGHRKRKRLRTILGAGSTDFLIDLWIGTAQNHPSGVLTGMDEMDIALEAGWTKEPKIFTDALTACKFLDKNTDGVFILHDWADHQGYVVHAEARTERARSAAITRWNIKKSVNGPALQQECYENDNGMPDAMPLPAPAPAPAPAPVPSPSPSPKPKTLLSDSEAFFTSTFWPAYPRREAKRDALKSWLKIEIELYPKIMDALSIQKSSQSWTKENGKYIPLPATWLNGKRWEDEICKGSDTRTDEERLNDRLKLLKEHGKNRNSDGAEIRR